MVGTNVHQIRAVVVRVAHRRVRLHIPNAVNKFCPAVHRFKIILYLCIIDDDSVIICVDMCRVAVKFARHIFFFIAAGR